MAILRKQIRLGLVLAEISRAMPHMVGFAGFELDVNASSAEGLLLTLHAMGAVLEGGKTFAHNLNKLTDAPASWYEAGALVGEGQD